MKSYVYAAYPQSWGEFDGRVSVLDVLFNMGPKARSVLKSRSTNWSLDGGTSRAATELELSGSASGAEIYPSVRHGWMVPGAKS
jgi:hypothetical protein